MRPPAQLMKTAAEVALPRRDRHDDAELARRNFHMTATQAASLAKRAGVGRLVLFHLSDRYRVPTENATMVSGDRLE
jgi:ribonuclease Z